jgi:SagB-type dehydrogenase family enzyme
VSSSLDTQQALAAVLAYHNRTKHSTQAYAKGPGSLDWDAQPSPFRRYAGAPIIHLELRADQLSLPFAALFNSAGGANNAIDVQPLNRTSIAALLEISLGLAAWKQYGTARWSLRCNPSSGNLHPTEAYVLAAGIEGLADGVYHYCADEHLLELRCRFADVEPSSTPQLLLGFSSVHWREAWKYGERAYRYCQLDLGHALAAVSYAGAVLGWQMQMHNSLSGAQLAQLLGTNRADDQGKAEAEHADTLIQLTPNGVPGKLDIADWLARAEQGVWQGKANILDRRHFYNWPIIDEVAEAASKPAIAPIEYSSAAILPPPIASTCDEPAAKLFQRRRSAQAFDRVTPMQQADFYRLLDHVLPRPGLPPWNASLRTAIHLVLFVHRVEGVAAGLYALPRSAATFPQLQAAMNPQFSWQREPAAPEHIPLYQLLPGNAQRVAARLACQQAIASDSAFSLAMLAEFDASLGLDGATTASPWVYPQLYWEAGVLGQALYLEAEACGLRGTGIGCFFDDSVHELLGLQSSQFQSLYHFTIGAPVVDTRIISLPPYSHLTEQRGPV